MVVFHFLEMKFLLLFAELFKIQSNWFFEGISIIISIAIIMLLSLSFIKVYKYNKSKIEVGFKRFRQIALFYLTAILDASFIVFLIFHLCVVIYIANSNHKLSDFTFHDNELHQELSNIDIYDKNGNKVYTIFNDGVNRETVSSDEMPPYLQDAFVAAEDKNFYHDTGVSLTGYIRAVYNKVLHPSMSMNGGSTITQELIKNVNGNIYNRTVLQKYQEALLSIIVENNYNKKQILEMYLNRIYLGRGNIYGIGTAARQYFNKDVSDLTLAESAYLAGLPQAPSSYTTNLAQGNKRKNIILDNMKDDGFITESQWEKATHETISLSNGNTSQSSAFDSYVDYVIKEAKQDYGLTDDDIKNKGFSIYTNLDTNFQNIMYQTAQNFTYRDDNNAQNQKVQVGMAAVDNNYNRIIALYGGRNFQKGNLNRADSYYQPGSIIKPLAVYTPAFETDKWSPLSQVMDKPKSFNGYSPKNDGNYYEGSITIQRALIRSANIPAVTVLQDIGVDKGVEALQKMDIEVQPKDESLSLALGGMQKGVTPIQMAQAYSIFPNDGYFQAAKTIKYIKDKNGNFIDKKDNALPKPIDVFSPENAYHMTEILEKVITDPMGTAGNANIGRPVAGKTGTAEEPGTTGNRAAWFVGYTPDITLSVHLGFDKPSNNLYLTTAGGGDPASLFSSIMRNALSDTPEKDFQVPTGVIPISSSVLGKAENVKAVYDSTNKQVTISWDRGKSVGNVLYKVYKKGKNGSSILLGTTNGTNFNDKNISVKSKLAPIPNNDNWTVALTAYVKNAITFIQNNIPDHNTYYVVATNQNQSADPSSNTSLFVPKLNN